MRKITISEHCLIMFYPMTGFGIIHWLPACLLTNFTLVIENENLLTHCFLFVVSSKPVLERPLGGSQIPFCPAVKKMSDCWSRIDPGTFRVRGENYLRYI